jgi:hypothetical protein
MTVDRIPRDTNRSALAFASGVDGDGQYLAIRAEIGQD